MPKPSYGPKAVWVRCLGPGPEHRFRTNDAKCNRVCKACRRKLDDISHRIRQGTERDPR